MMEGKPAGGFFDKPLPPPMDIHNISSRVEYTYGKLFYHQEPYRRMFSPSDQKRPVEKYSKDSNRGVRYIPTIPSGVSG